MPGITPQGRLEQELLHLVTLTTFYAQHQRHQEANDSGLVQLGVEQPLHRKHLRARRASAVEGVADGHQPRLAAQRPTIGERRRPRRRVGAGGHRLRVHLHVHTDPASTQRMRHTQMQARGCRDLPTRQQIVLMTAVSCVGATQKIFPKGATRAHPVILVLCLSVGL